MNSGANFLKNNTPRVAIGFFPCKTHCIQEYDEDWEKLALTELGEAEIKVGEEQSALKRSSIHRL